MDNIYKIFNINHKITYFITIMKKLSATSFIDKTIIIHST